MSFPVEKKVFWDFFFAEVKNSQGMPPTSWRHAPHMCVYLFFYSSQLNLYTIHGVWAIPYLYIGIFTHGKGAAELEHLYPSLNVFVKQPAKFAAFVGAQFELVTGFHPDGAIVLHLEYFCNNLVSNGWISNFCH
jgi:hypothetical protein